MRLVICAEASKFWFRGARHVNTYNVVDSKFENFWARGFRGSQIDQTFDIHDNAKEIGWLDLPATGLSSSSLLTT